MWSSKQIDTDTSVHLCVDLYSTVLRCTITPQLKYWLQVFNQCWRRCTADRATISMVTLVWHTGKGQQWCVLLLSPKLWWTNERLISHSCDETFCLSVCVCAFIFIFVVVDIDLTADTLKYLWWHLDCNSCLVLDSSHKQINKNRCFVVSDLVAESWSCCWFLSLTSLMSRAAYWLSCVKCPFSLKTLQLCKPLI